MQSAKRGFVFGVCLAALMAAGSVALADDSVSEDPRLDQKVTLSLGLVTLDKFAEEVSKQTGVTIEAGKNKKDWQVMERKTVVFAKDVPAKEILQQVAELHHYTLSGYGKGDKRYYRYWQDLKSRKEEEELREQDKTKPMEEYASALDEMAKLENAKDKMTAEQLAKLEKDDPYKHFLLTDPWGQALCGLAAQFPAQVFSRIDRNKWRLPVGPSDPKLMAAIQRFLEEVRKLNPKRSGDSDYDVTEIFLKVEFDDSQRGFGVLGRLEFGDFEIPMLRPGSYAREMVGRMYKAMRAGIDTRNATMEQLGVRRPEPLKDDPVLKEKVKIDAKEKCDYAAWLRAIHEKTGLIILSDSYWEQTESGLSGELSVKDVLDRVVFFDKAISKENSTITISEKQWYKKRAADIPDSYLERCTKKAETSGLSLDDLKQIALDLTDDQIMNNLMRRKVFEEYRFPLGGHKMLGTLRLLTLLTPDQISAITLTPEMLGGLEAQRPGLPLENLPADALKYALQATGKDISDVQGKKVTLSGYQEIVGGGSRGIRLRVNILGEQGEKDPSSVEVIYPKPKPPKDAKTQP